MIRRVATALLLSCLAAAAQAAPPPTYYQTITSQTGEALKLELRAIISGQRGFPVTPLSYDGARDALLASVDSVGGGNVRLIYTNETRAASQWAITVDREHTWPQSYGASVSPQKSDMHHLFLCDSSINSSRGNDLFGFVSGGTPTANPTGLPGNQCFRGGGVWQVSPNHRGDIARAMLYMETRYASFSLVSRGQTPTTGQMGYLDDLLQWNEQDPVDSFEQQRNDKVYNYQKNRNPYIDTPGWVALVYGGGTTSGPALANLALSPVQPDTTSTPTVTVDASDPQGVSTVTLNYRVGTTGSFSTVPMTFTSGSTYTATNAIPAQAEGTTVEYYVRATDTTAAESFAPASGALSPLSYVVAGNNPVLSSLLFTPSSVTSADSVSLRVNATDDDGNGAGNLTLVAYWRIAGSASFNSIPMGIVSGTTWQTTSAIPAQPEDTTVEYYVTASDAGSATTALPVGAPAAVDAYFVEAVQPFTAVTSVAQVEGTLLVSEYSYRTTADASEEFIEIVNLSTSQGFNLGGLSLNDNNANNTDTGEGTIRFPATATIAPGGIVVVYPRATPLQATLDAIPELSNRNGAAVQVYILESASASLTFAGLPVARMLETGANNFPQFADAGDNLALVFGTTETYTTAMVIDGVGYGTPSGPDDTVWGQNAGTPVVTSGVGNNVATGNNGAFRTVPTDTDNKADWAVNATATSFTPGLLPATFELPRIGVLIAGANYDGGTKVLTIAEGSTEQVTLALASDPGASVTVSVVATSGTAGAASFAVDSGAALTFNSGNFSTPKPISFSKAIDPDATADEVTYTVTGDNIATLAFTVREADNTMVRGWMLLD